MDTFLDMQTTVQSDLNVDSNSTLFPLATIKSAINRAYRKAGGFFRWPETQNAQKTSAKKDQEFYEYPNNWRALSVWKLTIDGKDYGDPLSFKDYLYEKENNVPSGVTYMWANQWRRYFVYPTPTADGNNNISIWGYKVVDMLSADEDTTIFSHHLFECNEAIVLEATAILKAKGEDDQRGQFKSLEAKQILTVAWKKILQDQAKQEKTMPFFNVSDMFGKSKSKDVIGDFVI